jgi:signal peptidase I
VIGPIPISSVIGRVDLIFWPLSKFQVLGSNEQKLLPQFP